MRNHNVAESEKENRNFSSSHLIVYAVLINHLFQLDMLLHGVRVEAKGEQRAEEDDEENIKTPDVSST